MPPGHDMVLAALGGVILWFGWYGFNPGSTLSAMDFDGIGRVAANTTLAACAGGLVAMFFVYPRSHKWDTGITINGFLAGLVAITCPCYWVSPFGAICIGVIAGRRGRPRCRPRSSTCASTTRSVRGRCTVCAASGARSVSGLFATGPIRPARPDRCRHVDDDQRPVLRRWCPNNCSPDHRQRRGHVRRVRRRTGRDVRREGDRRAADLRRARAREASTSSSTARRRTTPSSPTWATRRSPAAESGWPGAQGRGCHRHQRRRIGESTCISSQPSSRRIASKR